MRRGYFQELKNQPLISTVVVVVFTCLFFTKASAIYSRAVFIEMWVIGILLTYNVRCLRKLFLRRRMTDQKYLQKMILVSTADNVEETLLSLEEKKYSEFYVSGIILIDKTEEKAVGGIPVIASGENGVEVLQDSVVDQVFVDGSRRNPYVKEILLPAMKWE